MSKLLVNLALLQAKALVNAYTWTTLPFYALAQRPWHRLKLSKFSGVTRIQDSTSGRVIYSRPLPTNAQNKFLQYHTYNEMIPHLDKSRAIIGVRDVLSELPQLDAHGNPIKIDGKELKKVKLADEYRWYTVGEVLDRVDALARGLKQMGVSSGDKVIIYAENSFEWFCTSIALQRINAVTITLLSILNDEGILYGINQTEARYLITSQDLLKRLNSISDEIKHPLSVIYIKNSLSPNDQKVSKCIEILKRKFNVTTFDQVVETGNQLPVCDFPIPDPNDVALIMYTSGTTGNPKGVMLSHKNLMTGVHNLIRGTIERDTPLLNARYPAYLPFAHLYGYLINFAMFVSKSQIGLCSAFTMLDSSPAHVQGQVGDFKLLKPEFLAGVPLVLDRILKEVYRKLNSRSPISAPLFTYLMDYKIRWRSRGFDAPIINRLLCKKINEGFGGELKTILVGSAPLNERTQALAQAALNVTLLQGYGGTENTTTAHIMTATDLQYGECGVPFYSVQYYLKDWPEGDYHTTDKPNPRGEIVVGGDCVALGYFKMEEETEECFKIDQNGVRWFESGDIGEVLPDGTLKIIDRKKDLTKLANGEFVSLGKIESGLRSSAYVENICVCTDPYSNYVTALISPNHRTLTDLAFQLSKSHLTFDQQCDDPEIVQHILESLQITGHELGFSKKEIPFAITLVKEEWTQDNNLLTAALKLKRKQVNQFYAEQIRQMFDQN